MPEQEILGKIRCEFERCMPLFIALGDEVRQQIVLKLICAGCDGLRVGDITQATRLSRPAISHHLKILKNAGVVKVRRQGTMNFYYLDAETSLGNFGAMTAHIQTLVEQRREEMNGGR